MEPEGADAARTCRQASSARYGAAAKAPPPIAHESSSLRQKRLGLRTGRRRYAATEACAFDAGGRSRKPHCGRGVVALDQRERKCAVKDVAGRQRIDGRDAEYRHLPDRAPVVAPL